MKRRETILFSLVIILVAYLLQLVGHSNVLTKLQPVDERAVIAATINAMASSSSSLESAQKNSSCVLQGPLPDHACTPGAIFTTASTSTVCVSGYTKTVRNVPVRVKKQVYANYGIPYPQPSGSFELDHLIPLALGGNNSVANLFPEAASPTPGFKEKDIVENYLREAVCRGEISLPAAQKQIANDWVAVYDVISSSTISHLRDKYGSWSD